MTLKVVTLAHYLKKEYLDLDNFCFEITHTHLRQCGETSADLAANFKLTNHTAADFQIDQSYGCRLDIADEEAEEYDKFFDFL